MKKITILNVWENNYYSQVLNILFEKPKGLRLKNTVSKVDFPTCKNPYRRVNDILRDLRIRLRIIDYDLITKKYSLKSFTEDFKSFYKNKQLLEILTQKIIKEKQKEKKQFSSHLSPNIHVFNHDPQINEIVKEKYSRRMKSIVNKLQDVLKDLDRLREDIIQNDNDIGGYGFFKNLDGFTGSTYRKKSAFTIVMHTDEQDFADLFFSKNTK